VARDENGLGCLYPLCRASKRSSAWDHSARKIHLVRGPSAVAFFVSACVHGIAQGRMYARDARMRRPLVFVKQAIVTMATVLCEPAMLSPSMIEVVEPWPQKRASRMKVVEAGRRDPVVRLELESERVASVQYLRRCSGSTALRRRGACLNLAVVRDDTKRKRDGCQDVAGPAK